MKWLAVISLVASSMAAAAAVAAAAPIARSELPAILGSPPAVPPEDVYRLKMSGFPSLNELEEDPQERVWLRTAGYVAFYGKRWLSETTLVYVVAIAFRGASGPQAMMRRYEREAARAEPRLAVAPVRGLGDEAWRVSMPPQKGIRGLWYFWRYRNVVLSVTFGTRSSAVTWAGVRAYADAIQLRARRAAA